MKLNKNKPIIINEYSLSLTELRKKKRNKRRRHIGNSNPKSKFRMDVYHLNKLKRKRYYTRMISLICERMKLDIEKSIKNGDKKNVITNYKPLPVICVSSKTIDKYFGFDNVLILKEPKLDEKNKNGVIYNSTPMYIGSKLKEINF